MGPERILGKVGGHSEREADVAAAAATTGPRTHELDLRMPATYRRPDTPGRSLRVPADVDRVITRPAAQLDSGIRGEMQGRFQHDFSNVRVHNDSDAARSADQLGARAYTVGRDIVFGAGQLQLGTASGRHLLAHELTHTIQQRAAPPLRRAWQPGAQCDRVVQRQAVPGARSLDDRYSAAVASARQSGNWQEAAELLNAFSHEDIQVRLAALSDQEVELLHAGAVENPRVGPDAQVATLTAPGAPRASTPPRNASTARPSRRVPEQTQGAADRAPDADAVARMSSIDKLIAAYRRARLAPAFRAKLESMITPQALVLAIVGFVVAFVASQFTPVGWAADIGIALTAVFIASSLMATIRHLIGFAAARNATTPEDLDRAGGEFAAATAEFTVDALLFLVSHRAGGEGGVPPESPPAVQVQVRLGVTTNGRLIPVLADTVPAAVIPVRTAAVLGAQAAVGAPMLMSAMSGGGPGGPTGSGGSSGSGRSGPRPGSREAEQTFIGRLKDRFPRLRSLDIRPRSRPSASRHVSKVESDEVGGAPEYRTEVGGAPEHAFEERMQTSQGNFSYVVYGEGGRPVFEFDGISVDGWLEEIKIAQSMGRIDEIMAQLRVQADFAETYGLRGVRYSIAPPEVAAEVERRVAEEMLTNVYRAE